MEFKIGDIVRIISKKSDCLNGFEIGEKVKITDNKNDGCHKYKLKNLEENLTGYANEEDLQLITFQVGDKVKVRLDCTLEDIFENHCHGCLENTMRFIKSDRYAQHKVYTIIGVNDKGDIYLDEESNKLNFQIFELVERKENIKEMTVEEISKELGYEVKIVKGDK